MTLRNSDKNYGMSREEWEFYGGRNGAEQMRIMQAQYKDYSQKMNNSKIIYQQQIAPITTYNPENDVPCDMSSPKKENKPKNLKGLIAYYYKRR